MADQENSDWIVTELRRAAVSERAPARLREEIDAMSRRPERARRRTRRWALVPAVGALAAVILALVFALPGGAGGPTVAQAAVAATQGGWWSYNQPKPGDAGTAEYASFADVRLPSDLTGDKTWKFSGEHVETIDGHKLLDLFYVRGKRLLVYAIAAKPLLRGQQGGFRSLRPGGRTVVSWQESGHSCLLISETASAATLLSLARS
jgi:hypothetical protein